MKVSVCITVLNAQKLISPLLNSLLSQTLTADEIVIVDGGSTDRTIEILKHFQKKDKSIKLLFDRCLRARGRNLAVEIAKNPIIAMTDAGCIAKKDWLKKITGPLANKKVDIVAGIYEMKGDTPMQKALGIFLGFPVSKFSKKFLPTTRSIAFRKEVWEEVGGFTERMVNSAEDSEFNEKALKLGKNYSRVKDAKVKWGIPESLGEGLKTMGDYAKWDAAYGSWWNPIKGITSHNIKILFIFTRYLSAGFILILSFVYLLLLVIIILLVIVYVYWSYRKVFRITKSFTSGIWGILIQITSDFAVMAGFLQGIALKGVK